MQGPIEDDKTGYEKEQQIVIARAALAGCRFERNITQVYFLAYLPDGREVHDRDGPVEFGDEFEAAQTLLAMLDEPKPDLGDAFCQLFKVVE